MKRLFYQIKTKTHKEFHALKIKEKGDNEKLEILINSSANQVSGIFATKEKEIPTYKTSDVVDEISEITATYFWKTYGKAMKNIQIATNRF